MTDDPADKAGTQDARALLLESEAVLKDLLDGFRSMSERLADGQDVRPAEIKKAITALATVRATILHEVNRHESRVLKAEGLTASSPLDFDEIRFEIGGRLDRIRRSRRAEDVSGEPDE